MIRPIQWVALLVLLSFAQVTNATEVNMPGVELTETEWWVEDIEGRGVIDRSHTTLEFIGIGKVAGDTGCNRYFGTTETVGAGISFGPLAGTRKACSTSLMNQETKFYQAIAKVVSWEVPVTGLLHLRDAEGNTMIRAWRVEE